MTIFKRAVVGVDQSSAESSRPSGLPDLARWDVETVILAHVIQIGRVHGAGYGHEEDYIAWLERCAEPLKTAGLRVETSVTTSGVPAEAFVTSAGGRS